MPDVDPLQPWRILIKDMGGPGPNAKKRLTFNAPTQIWSRTTGGIISYPSTVTASPGGPYAVNPIVVPFDPIHETGGSFWRLTEGPNVGFLVSFWSNSLGYGDITVDDGAFDRGPGATLATLYQPNAHSAGATLNYNAGGEMHFTLLVDDPNILIPKPKQTHYAVEFFRGGQWVEEFAGLIWDMDATDTEVVFYGIDYLAMFQYTIDERFDPKKPDKPVPTGSKYVDKTITEIVTEQINYAISRPDSIVGFIQVGSIAAMNEKVTIFSTLQQTLPFVMGLLDSHRAGTGKFTRWSIKKLAGVYTAVIEDNPGAPKDDLALNYGTLVQGYRVIPFGERWASRVNTIGRSREGLNVLYRSDSSAIDQGMWGRIAQEGNVIESVDENDLKRRTLQAAIDASRLGTQISVGLKLGSYSPRENYDITDWVPVTINHGAVQTQDWGNDDFGVEDPQDPSTVNAAYWTILGIKWNSFDDGHWMTNLTLYPHGRRPTGCVPPQSHLFSGTGGGADTLMYEISGVERNPVAVFTNQGLPIAGNPLAAAGPLDPGQNGIGAIIIAAWVLDAEGRSGQLPATSPTLVIDRTSFIHNTGDSAPHVITGHQIIPSTSGTYSPVAQTANGDNLGSAQRLLVASVMFRAIEGKTPAIVQKKIGIGSGGGPYAVAFDSPCQKDSVLVAFSAARNSPGNINMPTDWSGTAMLDTCPGNPTEAAQQHRYGRLMWYDACSGMDVPSTSSEIKPPAQYCQGLGPPPAGTTCDVYTDTLTGQQYRRNDTTDTYDPVANTAFPVQDPGVLAFGFGFDGEDGMESLIPGPPAPTAGRSRRAFDFFGC